MGYTLSCKDAGMECPFVAYGNTYEEVIHEATAHVNAVHGVTDEQLPDTKFMEETKKLIKRE